MTGFKHETRNDDDDYDDDGDAAGDDDANDGGGRKKRLQTQQRAPGKPGSAAFSWLLSSGSFSSSPSSSLSLENLHTCLLLLDPGRGNSRHGVQPDQQ